jgi:thioredoxin-like negative regulator of GroEL
MKRLCVLLLLAISHPGASQATAPVPEEPWAFSAPLPRIRQQMPAGATGPNLLGQDTRAHYEAALRALASNDLSRATLEIQSALVQAPDHPDILAIAGRIYTRQGSHGLAANCWRQLLALYPGSATVRAEYGATLLYMGKDTEARRAITEALAASPGDLTARYYQGLLLVKERAFEQAALNFVPLNGWQVLQAITRLQEDRERVIGLTSTEGYRNLARALLNAKTGDDTETVLARVKQHLQDVQPLMQAGQWAAAEPHLRAAYQAGARFPALEYDLGICRYSMTPGPAPLDELEKLIVSPRGIGFRRLFTYLCFQAGDAARAERATAGFLQADPDPEAILLRAAIRQGLNDEAGAWALLDTVPVAARSATRPWFEQRLAFIQQLKDSPRFAAWIDPRKNE